MPPLSPLQTLPYHAVETIVDYVTYNTPLTPDTNSYDIDHETYHTLQIPLLWVCRNLRGVVELRLFKYYSLDFDKAEEIAVGEPVPWSRNLERLNIPCHLMAKVVRVSISPGIIYSGKALTYLSRMSLTDDSFPLARRLDIHFTDSPDRGEYPAVPRDVMDNISAFIRQIRQMVPKLNMVRLLGSLDVWVEIGETYLPFNHLATQLCQLVTQVDLGFGFGTAFTDIRLDGIYNLTYLDINFDPETSHAMELVRRNAPILQYLRIWSYESPDYSGIIRDDGGGYVVYPLLEKLTLALGGLLDLLPSYNYNGIVPFPSLRRLSTEVDFPFGDDLVLFKGNAATLETLEITVTRELAVSLLQHNIFTPTSHPRLQCITLWLSLDMRSVNYADNPELVQFMLGIAPGAAVRTISSWLLDQTPLPDLSLFSMHTSLQVLALPHSCLSVWSAITLIRSLPLLSDFHSRAPTLNPMPTDTTESNLIEYVCTNYSPIGLRFRCWHIGSDDGAHLKGAVKPFLLLALACPNFDQVAVVRVLREKCANLLKEGIEEPSYEMHAPRLHRLVSHILPYQ